MVAVRAPSGVIVVRVGDADEESVRKILEAADRVRNEFGISIRIDVASTLEFNPLFGWMHNITIADTVDLNEGSYVILRDGPSVDVVFVKEPQDEYEIEGALTEAAVAALSGGQIGSTGKSETPLARRDPDTFAAGEYVVLSAAS
jgi:hypothetical protein